MSRKYLFPALLKLRIEHLLSFGTNNRLILNYHGVINEDENKLSKNHLSIKQFEEHLKYFKDNFDVVPLQDIVLNNKFNSKNQKKKIAITFDDGYYNNYVNAIPLLEKYNFPATIFSTAWRKLEDKTPLWYDIIDFLTAEYGTIELAEYFSISDNLKKHNNSIKSFFKTINYEKRNNYLKKLNENTKYSNYIKSIRPELWELMSCKEIKHAASGNLITFGSHGLTHTNLDILDSNELKIELKSSKDYLSSCTETDINIIAFPDGAYNEKVKEIAFESGYKDLFAVNYRTKTDHPENHIFQRFSISNTTTYSSIIMQIHLAFRRYGF